MTTGLRDRLPLFKSTVRVGRARASTPQPDVVADRYECEAELGKGGMGRVERGLDRFLGRTVALKWSLTDEPHMLQLLLREAEIASRLNHPSIVTIHDVARDEDDKPFVVMRLVDGRRLSEVVAESPELSSRLQLLPRLATAIDAIAYAHAQGVVHRDLKPDNILLGQHGETVVIDWGLALDLRGGDPFAGEIVGTEGFMSPEQARGETVDARTDVYALGITMARMLPSEPGTPRDLLAIMAKATATDRSDRYPSAGELAADLQRFIGGQLVAAHHYSLGQRIVRWVQRHRALVATSSIALVTSGVIGVISIRGVVAARAVAESERAIAVSRADQLLVDRARDALELDPPRALALLDLRSTRERDAGVWAVAVEAVARGVPRVWKPHETLVSAVVALGQGRVASSDRTGAIVFRSGNGTLRTIATFPGPAYVHAVSGGFVASGPGRIELFDKDGTSIRTWTEATPNVVAGGNWITTVQQPAVVFRNLDDGATRTVELAPVAPLHIDPTGKWAAIPSSDAVHVVELASGTVHRLASEVRVLMWSPLGDRLLGVTRDTLVEWDASDWTRPPRTWKEPPGIPAYLGNQAASISLQGCFRIASTYVREPVKCYPSSVQGVATIAAGTALTDGSVVEVFPVFASNDIAPIRLTGVPAHSLRLAMSDDAREVVAGTQVGYVAYWDLAARGVRLDDLQAERMVILGERMFVDSTNVLYELERDRTRKVGPIPETIVQRDFFTAGSRVVMHAVLDLELYELREDRPELLVKGIVAATERSTTELVIADVENRAGILDLNTKTITIAATHDAKISAVAGDATTIAAAWEDGYVWWRDRTGEHSANAGCNVTLVLLRGDTLEVACGTQILGLSARGDITPLATLPEPVTTWTTPDHDGPRAIVTVNNAIWKLDRGRLALLESGSTKTPPAISDDRFATADRLTGHVYVYDLRTGVRAHVGSLRSPYSIAMASDGRSVMVRGPHKVFRWYDPTPRDPAAWPAWKASVTPVTLRDPSATLDWR